jgi:hypothetical protein
MRLEYRGQLQFYSIWDCGVDRVRADTSWRLSHGNMPLGAK